ncbi:DUF2281 domain-containing protein [Crocosphaera sp. UHCC 0190]|uniref:type II toxin-antitoxin system VapB family antitoxin n=1 Tax=Crocosphaera sp. UHCC 0190 TaxID=3110246 RepID=UPI002B2215B6|nr:DUF2281 domain-containing protein [Crocosphaera sp. UHCC 0190]MEA5512340.1 DUF2281 domain-containing protein [Crocosphaera sp. UHCC 0190]
MMSTDTALWNIVENMPDSLKIELLQYAEYLMTKSLHLQPEEKSEEITTKKVLAGSMKGTFILPLSEDFDEPLEDFIESIEPLDKNNKNQQKTVIEKMGGYPKFLLEGRGNLSDRDVRKKIIGDIIKEKHQK